MVKRTTVRVHVKGTATVTVKIGQGKNRPRTPQSLVLYRGPSQLDGTPIVAVATNLRDRSKNPKTGHMCQVFILADAGEDPIEANQSGRDRAICGDCPHRDASCYVNLAFSPLAVYRAFKKGTYPRLNRRKHARLFRGRKVRFGAYGDPAAVPLWVWEWLASVSAGTTGYTHQWQDCDPGYARFLMASVDTPGQRERALAKGYRTFRVRFADQPLLPGEFICPASAEDNHRLTCEECMACSGSKAGGKNASPAIYFHGSTVGNGHAERVFRRTVSRLEAEDARRFALPTVN